MIRSIFNLSILLWLMLIAGNAQGQDIEDETGIFLDTLKIPGNELRIAITISRGEEGLFKASFNSLDQGSGEIAFDEVIINGSHILLSSKAGIEIEGDYDADFFKITGEFRQGPARFLLEFLRIEHLPYVNRPQEPKSPFPYLEEKVYYMNDAAGIQLAGTLTVPEGEGPFPAVVLLSGSGPQDRDETIFDHKPFAVIADYLTRNGIAVLRSDDRGVGESGGEFTDATTEDFADDGLAGVAYLKTRPEIMTEKIGFIGHSEGGMMAPLAATRSDDIAFIVLMAGPGVNLGDNVAYQGRHLMEKRGASQEYLLAQNKFQLGLNELARSNKSKEEASLEALKIFKALSEQEQKALNLNEKQVKAASEALLSNWWRYALRFDPEATLSTVKCPVLALLGENDRQVPAELNYEALKRALADNHEANRVAVIPG